MITTIEKNYELEEILKSTDYGECEKQQGTFDNFYEPFLNYFSRQNGKLYPTIMGYGIDEGSVEQGLVKELKNKLVSISIQTLITYFHESALDHNYELFNRSFLQAENIKKVMNRYPGLCELIQSKLRKTGSFISEILYSADRDMDTIRTIFQGQYQCLKEIKISLGDTHNNGKSVAVLCFNHDEKIVYKPRGLKTDLAFATICRWLNAANNFYEIKTVSTIHRENYGWQEYIELNSELSEGEVSRYCRRIGYLLAIFRVLNTTDIHAENILPMGEYPMLVDLETITANRVMLTDGTSLSDSVQDVLFHSVMSSCLLPSRSLHSPLDLDLSGLGGKEGQRSSKMKYEQLVGAGTDHIHFEKRCVESSGYNNRIRCQGKTVRFSEYVAEIETGFCQIYDYISSKKEVFQEIVDGSLKNAEIRQVLRGTYVYERYLSAVYHPNYLQKKEERNRLFNLIKKHNNEKENEEVHQMMNHDFPYFLSNYSNRDLYTVDGICAKEYFVKSVKDIITQNINGLGRRDREFQLYLIRNSLMTGKDDIMKGNVEDTEFLLKNCRTPLEAAAELGDHIMEYSIWNKAGTSCTFLDIQIGDHGSAITSMEFNLYQMGGLILFFFALAKETKSDDYKCFGEAVLRGMEELYSPERISAGTSVFSGFSSLLYLYYNLYRLTGVSLYRKKYLECLKKLQTYNGFGAEATEDIIGGLAGCIIMLCGIYEYEHEPMLWELIKSYGRCLEEKCIRQKPKLTGFAHGCSGYALALALAAKRTDNKELFSAALDLVAYEDQDFIQADGNWKDKRAVGHECCCYWCHGAPGILLARCMIAELTDDARIREQLSEKIKIAQKVTLDSLKNMHNHSLCHGQMGNLEILQIVSRSAGDSQLHRQLIQQYHNILRDVMIHGIKYGIPGVKGIFSFMQGLSGIAYGFLRSVNPDYPSVLSLQIYGGDYVEN